MKALYITNLGLLDNLAKTQILPYIDGISKNGTQINILSFEKKEHLIDRSKVNDMEKRLKDLGIGWDRLPYHSRWGNVLDLFMGLIKTLQIVKDEDIAILHARASIPIFIAWPVAKFLKCKIIYDRRGTIVGDFVDDVNKKNIFSFRFFSIMLDVIDKFMIRYSDATIVLSERAKGMLNEDRYIKGRDTIIEDIPCCVDMSKFSNVAMTKKLKIGLQGKFVMVYVGSLGTCYLLREMVAFFKILKGKVQNTLFLIISHTDKAYVEVMLKREGLVSGVDYIIVEADPEEVPQYLVRCNFSIMFIKPVECKIGSSPTKFAESLAAGVPVIVNKGIGDTEDIVKANNVGVVVESFEKESCKNAISELLELLTEEEDLKKRCNKTAGNLFSLDLGIRKYTKIYEMLKREKK